MAWQEITWACGHHGEKQLYGKIAGRDAKAAFEAGRKCMVCWLVDQWKKNKDPRAEREDCFSLAADIAKGKGVRFLDLTQFGTGPNPLARFSDDEIIVEAKKRGLIED